MTSSTRPLVVLHVHACPPAVSRHVEWALAGVLGVPVDLTWVDQPAEPGAVRSEVAWRARPGTAGRITSALRGWSVLRFEVTEEASVGCDGVRYSHSPSLGLFATPTSANGDVMIGEDRLRALLAATRDGAELAHALDRLLGAAWDADLEPYRRGAEGAPVTWLHRTG